MGREVRMVPPMWEHPKYPGGGYIPLFGDNIVAKTKEWEECSAKWEEGYYFSWHQNQWLPRDQNEDTKDCKSYSDWNGDRPDPASHFPVWQPGEASWYAYYENTTEGTPLSPAFPTKTLLAKWLSEQGDVGGSTWTYEEWIDIL